MEVATTTMAQERDMAEATAPITPDAAESLRLATSELLAAQNALANSGGTAWKRSRAVDLVRAHKAYDEALAEARAQVGD